MPQNAIYDHVAGLSTSSWNSITYLKFPLKKEIANG